MKLGTDIESGWMYRVHRNQAVILYLSLYFFMFLSLQISNIKLFHHTFLMNCLAYKVETWHTYGQWVDVSESGCCFLPVPLFLHFFLQFPNIKIFVTFFSGTMKNSLGKFELNTNMNSWLMYRLYWNRAVCAYLFDFLLPVCLSPQIEL